MISQVLTSDDENLSDMSHTSHDRKKNKKPNVEAEIEAIKKIFAPLLTEPLSAISQDLVVNQPITLTQTHVIEEKMDIQPSTSAFIPSSSVDSGTTSGQFLDMDIQPSTSAFIPSIMDSGTIAGQYLDNVTTFEPPLTRGEKAKSSKNFPIKLGRLSKKSKTKSKK